MSQDAGGVLNVALPKIKHQPVREDLLRVITGVTPRTAWVYAAEAEAAKRTEFLCSQHKGV